VYPLELKRIEYIRGRRTTSSSVSNKKEKEKIESRHETLKCTEWYLVVNSRNDKRESREEKKSPEKGCVGNGR
jgi:hypothetical protein